MKPMKRVCQTVLLALALGAGATPAYAVADPTPVDPFVPGINEDPDLAGTGSVSVQASSPLQPDGVSFTLAETSRAGLFRGSIPLDLPGQAPGGTLIVQSDQSIEVTYADASAGQTRLATAIIETTLPIISSVSADPSYTEVVVSLQTFACRPDDFASRATTSYLRSKSVHLVVQRSRPDHELLLFQS